MRITLALVALLYSTAIMAQANPPPAAGSPPPASAPPTVGGQPLVQVKPHAAKTAAAPAAKESGQPKSIAKRLQACLEIDDGTKGRLDCYDEVIKPAPKEKAAAAKTVMECKYTKEEDERLACYNGFVDMMPKLPKS
jgi:hypothetical protein